MWSTMPSRLVRKGSKTDSEGHALSPSNPSDLLVPLCLTCTCPGEIAQKTNAVGPPPRGKWYLWTRKSKPRLGEGNGDLLSQEL